MSRQSTLLAFLLASSFIACSSDPEEGGDGTGDGIDRTDVGESDVSDDVEEDTEDESDAEEEEADTVQPPDTIDRDNCASAVLTAEQTILPVDIIFIIDNSTSMDAEIAAVEANLNRFTEFIGTSGLDYRVVMISSDVEVYENVPGFGEILTYHDICVPPPLSGGFGCPDVDGVAYYHVRTVVNSNDGLQVALDNYNEFRGFLRGDSVQHVVMVTDDVSDMPASTFMSSLSVAGGPWTPETMTFHSIVGLGGDSCAAGTGADYQLLSNETGGVIYSICQENWQPIFDAIGQSVVEGTSIPCQFDLPSIEDDRFQVDPDQVNVLYTPSEEGAASELVPRVSSASDCGARRGWYYDNPEVPRRVNLCPAVCGALDGAIDLEFGCETVKE